MELYTLNTTHLELEPIWENNQDSTVFIQQRSSVLIIACVTFGLGFLIQIWWIRRQLAKKQQGQLNDSQRSIGDESVISATWNKLEYKDYILASAVVNSCLLGKMILHCIIYDSALHNMFWCDNLLLLFSPYSYDFHFYFMLRGCRVRVSRIGSNPPQRGDIRRGLLLWRVLRRTTRTNIHDVHHGIRCCNWIKTICGHFLGQIGTQAHRRLFRNRLHGWLDPPGNGQGRCGADG